MVSIDPYVVNDILLSMDSILASRDAEYQNPILRFEYEIDIELPTHQVFPYLVEPEKIIVWNSDVMRVERESTLPLQKGAVQNMHMSTSQVIRQVYVEYVENEMFAIMEAHEGIIAVGKYDILPIELGTKIRINQMVTHHKSMNGAEVDILKGALNRHLEKRFNHLKEMITQA